jgi:hypothetical protein
MEAQEGGFTPLLAHSHSHLSWKIRYNKEIPGLYMEKYK